jgi:hypothetical protein
MSKIEVNAIEPQCGTTLTLGANNDKITLGTGASFGGGVAAIKWETTAQTGDFGALSGRGYFVNTTSAPRTVTLPATPSAGDIVAVADYAGTAETNNITIARNGSNINGAASDITISKSNSAITLVYVDGTQGWKGTDTLNLNDIELQPGYITATGGTITECGNFKIHTFTGPGTFCVSAVGNPLGSTTLDYLVVAGGGGGGNWASGGGAGGGFRESVPSPAAWTASPIANPGGALTAAVQSYPITVGAGGAGSAAGPGSQNGGSGNPSTFSTIVSTGGGYGGGYNVAGAPGGSGGGGGHPSQPGGTGNTPPVSPSQGFNGGLGNTGGPGAGAGGGGATEVGENGLTSGPFGAGRGGAGATTSISATPTAYAGGGGGGSDNTNMGAGSPCGTGGQGGGANNSPRGATAGTTNRGGGGGGVGGPSNPTGGAAGGSGIVIIRYKYQ